MACNYNLYSKSETVINSLGIFSNFYKIFKTIKNQIIVKRKTIFRHFRLEEIKSLLLMIIIIVIILLFSFIWFKNHFVRMIVRQIHIVLIVSIIAISPPVFLFSILITMIVRRKRRKIFKPNTRNRKQTLSTAWKSK